MPYGTIKFDLGGLPDSCGSPLYLAPAGEYLWHKLRLPSSKRGGIITDYWGKVKKKLTTDFLEQHSRNQKIKDWLLRIRRKTKDQKFLFEKGLITY